MKMKMTPIVAWSVWGGGLFVVLALTTNTYLVQGFRTDKTGLIYLIAIAFAIGLILSFLAARKLRAEQSTLEQCTASGKIPVSASDTDLAALFRRLEAFKEQGELVDVHPAVDAYHAQYFSRIRRVSILSSLVISLGILGTVVGLIISIAGLTGMVENIGMSREAMMGELKTTVAGMGTAFYTTFFGIVAGAILRALAGSQTNALNELCATAAEHADAHFVARVENKEEQLNQSLIAVINSFKSMESEIQAVTARMTESFETAIGGFGTSLAAASEHAMEATKTSISGMTERMNAYGGEIGEAFGAFNESLAKVGEQTLEATQTTLSGLSERFDQCGGEVQEAFGAFNERVAQAGEATDAAFGELNERIAKAGEATDTAFDGVKEAIVASGERLGSTFGGLDGVIGEAGDTVAGSLAEFKLSIDGTALGLNESVGELRGAIAGATGEMTTLNGAKLDVEAKEIAGQLSLAAESIQRFVANKSVAPDADDNAQEVA